MQRLSENDIHGGSKLMVTVIIVVFILKYSVEILVGNNIVCKNFGRYKNSRSKIWSAEKRRFIR